MISQGTTAASAGAEPTLLATNVTREFALQWTTPEQDWSRNVALEQRIVSSFDTR
jgi:hypothetical protein